jgi:hypothetical protein
MLSWQFDGFVGFRWGPGPRGGSESGRLFDLVDRVRRSSSAPEAGARDPAASMPSIDIPRAFSARSQARSAAKPPPSISATELRS